MELTDNNNKNLVTTLCGSIVSMDDFEFCSEKVGVEWGERTWVCEENGKKIYLRHCWNVYTPDTFKLIK